MLSILYEGNRGWPVDSLHKVSVMLSFDVFYNINPNKAVNKESKFGWFDYYVTTHRHKDFHYKDKTAMRTFHLYNENSYTDKMTSLPWWRHQMETVSALLAICAGNSPVPDEFPTQRPVTRSFDFFLSSASESTVKWTIVRLVIWDAIVPIMTSHSWLDRATNLSYGLGDDITVTIVGTREYFLPDRVQYIP